MKNVFRRMTFRQLLQSFFRSLQSAVVWPATLAVDMRLNFGSKNYERRKRENPTEIEKLDEDAMLCNTLWSDRRRLITKTFLAFSRTSKHRN